MHNIVNTLHTHTHADSGIFFLLLLSFFYNVVPCDTDEGRYVIM